MIIVKILKWGNYFGFSKWALSAITCIFIKRYRETPHLKEDLTYKKGRQCDQRGRDWIHKLKNAGNHQNLEDAGNRFFPKASRGRMAVLTPCVWPSKTDFRPLASRTVKK